MKRKRLDLILLILWPIIASLASIWFNLNFFTSTILFYLLPSLYISWRCPQLIRKTLKVCFVVLPILLITDWIAVKTGVWYFPTSIFSGRLFGTTVFEVVFWFFLFVYFVIVFYEYFFDSHVKEERPHKGFKYLALITAICFTIFLLLLFTLGTFVQIPYIYFIFGIIFCFIPIPLILFKFPRLLTKFVQVTVYFFLSSFLWEIVALKLNQWTFPGKDFIGWVEIFDVRFPIEELLVWIVLGATSIVAWYEYFDDDCK